MGTATRRTFVVHVEDKPGVLNRVASLFRRRAFNIESLTVGRTHEAGVSRMTIVVDADDDTARRVEANLYKLINVISVDDITSAPAVTRVLAMIKLRFADQRRSEALQICEVFRARIVDAAAGSLIIESTGTREKVDALLEALEPFEVVEAILTGAVAMTRGPPRAVPSLAGCAQ